MEDDPATKTKKNKIIYIDNKFKTYEILDPKNKILETKFIET